MTYIDNKTNTIPNLRTTLVLGLSLLFLLISCKEKKDWSYTAEQSEIYETAAIVSAHPLASDVGEQILEQGGNAVDAIIAVQFTLAVVYPRAGNIGGGGFMIYRANDGTTATLDYREKAPSGADKDMYLDSLGNVVQGLSSKGHLSVGVPGTVAGLVEAHSKYGNLEWKKLIQPAIDFATEGYAISQSEADRLNKFQKDFVPLNDASSPFIKEHWKAGDILVQKDLAATLSLIRDRQRAGFYTGKTADLIVAEMQEGHGLITKQDLMDYKPVWRPAVEGFYEGYKIISMPPPSSGGITLLQMLGLVQDYPLSDYHFQGTDATHLMVEAERRAFSDRAKHLGDSDFYPVPIDSLLSIEYLASLMDFFNADSATVSDKMEVVDFIILKESFETTHISIVDKDGNAASVTTTLNSNFGSKVIVDDAGFFLNNEMDDFSAKPGVPNIYGLVGAEANAIAPHKRMLSSMTPTIIEKDGELFMVLGSPGGSTIITSVYQVFLNVTAFEMPLDSAVWAPRFHHQWLPDQIWVEPSALSPAVKDSLMAMGHKFREVKALGKVKAILRLPDGRLHAVGDNRNLDDDVSGY